MAAIHCDEFKRDAVRIALSSCLTRSQVASDLGVGHSTLGKWVRAFSEESKVPAQNAEFLRENERLRKEIFEYINRFYNPRRKHSALGWKAPVAFEQKAA